MYNTSQAGIVHNDMLLIVNQKVSVIFGGIQVSDGTRIRREYLIDLHKDYD